MVIVGPEDVWLESWHLIEHIGYFELFLLEQQKPHAAHRQQAGSLCETSCDGHAASVARV